MVTITARQQGGRHADGTVSVTITATGITPAALGCDSIPFVEVYRVKDADQWDKIGTVQADDIRGGTLTFTDSKCPLKVLGTSPATRYRLDVAQTTDQVTMLIAYLGELTYLTVPTVGAEWDAKRGIVTVTVYGGQEWPVTRIEVYRTIGSGPRTLLRAQGVSGRADAGQVLWSMEDTGFALNSHLSYDIGITTQEWGESHTRWETGLVVEPVSDYLYLQWQPEKVAVRIDIPGTGWPSLVDNVTVYRSVIGGTREEVPELIHAPAAGGYLVGSDHLAPLNQPVRYDAVGYRGTLEVATQSATVTTTAREGVWLRALEDASATICAEIDSIGDLTSATHGETLKPPKGGGVTYYTGVAPNDTDLTFWVRGNAAIARARALLKYRILLIDTVPDGDLPSGWYGVGQVNEKLLAQVKGGGDGRTYSLDLTETERPTGDVQVAAGVTWADVIDRYATWADLLKQKRSWYTLMQGID